MRSMKGGVVMNKNFVVWFLVPLALVILFFIFWWATGVLELKEATEEDEQSRLDFEKWFNERDSQQDPTYTFYFKCKACDWEREYVLGVHDCGEDKGMVSADRFTWCSGQLLDAIEFVESRGDPGAVGAAGELGAYQITKGYVDDVNRIIDKLGWVMPFYEYADRYSKTKSREMVRIYVGYYGALGTDEKFARIHNAGPDGWRNDPRWFVRNREYTLEDAVTKINNSLAYWELVKNALEEVK